MTDWTTLSHAYGKSGDIPGLLDQTRTGSSDEAWQELWSCLCHQGTVYPASYAALAPLCDMARTVPPQDRFGALTLAGAIIASDDLYGVPERPRAAIEPLLPSFRDLADQSMTATGWTRECFIYLLQAASAFAGHLFWGRHLDNLASGEFPGNCPACAHDLYLVVGGQGFFAVTQEWTGPRDAGSRRVPITPARLHDLQGASVWLHATASSHRQLQVAVCLRHVFGTTTCPACGAGVNVAGAVAAACVG